MTREFVNDTLPPERRSDAVKLAVLETEMKAVSHTVEEILAQLKTLSESVNEGRLEGAERQGAMKGIMNEQRVIRALVEKSMDRQDLHEKKLDEHMAQELLDLQNLKPVKKDTLERWKETAVNGLIVALCLAAVLAIGVFMQRNLLSKDAMKTAGFVLEHAP